MANHQLHKAQTIIVIVDHIYHQKTIGNAIVGSKNHVQTVANTIIKVILHDCTNKVNANQISRNIQGFIQSKLVILISVRNINHSFMQEKARNINHKLSMNLLIATTLFQREKKLIHTAHKNIKGNAKIETSKLIPTIHKIEVGIIVPTFAHRITANADVKDKIPVHTNAKTRTDITFELCNIVVVIIQLKKDFGVDDVNFCIKFLNHPLENEETACSIYIIQNKKNPIHPRNCNIQINIL